MIDVCIVADSVSEAHARIVTAVWTYPRFIHSEVMTHRVFSRNAASSRAIPVEKMIARIEQEPAMPVYWGQNCRGMSASQAIDDDLVPKAKVEWLLAMKDAVAHARNLAAMGVHKQVTNRVVEPYAHMTTVITSTEWSNFFALRVDKEAQPEFFVLAQLMLRAYLNSRPKALAAGSWHLPFADKYLQDVTEGQALKIVTARCARVSYLNFEGDIDYEKDYALHDDLLAKGHMSPFEHAARAEDHINRSGNFLGFTQYRKQFDNECRHLSYGELERLLEESE